MVIKSSVLIVALAVLVYLYIWHPGPKWRKYIVAALIGASGGILLARAAPETVRSWDPAITQSPGRGALRWKRENVRVLTQLERYDREELEFLRPLLAGKRIVMLGESSHRVVEYSQAKANIIRFLHEELGFNVLAWESRMFAFKESYLPPDVVCRDLDRDVLVKDAMWGICGTLWDTPSVRRFFDYVVSERDSESPIRIMGFDMDQSGHSFPRSMDYFSELLEAHGSATVESVAWAKERFGPAYANSIKKTDPMAREIREFFDGLSAEFDGIAATHPGDERELGFAAQWCRNLIHTPYLQDLGRTECSELRDELMANNVSFLVDRYYPDEKIILWAHNFHIDKAKSQARVVGLSLPALACRIRYARVGLPRSMGEYLQDRYGDRSYVIGLFMATGSRGVYIRRLGKVVSRDLLPLKNDSIEKFLYDPSVAATFLDLSRTGDPDGLEWRRTEHRYINENLWYSMIPADHFDGLLVVSKAHAAYPGDR